MTTRPEANARIRAELLDFGWADLTMAVRAFGRMGLVLYKDVKFHATTHKIAVKLSRVQNFEDALAVCTRAKSWRERSRASSSYTGFAYKICEIAEQRDTAGRYTLVPMTSTVESWLNLVPLAYSDKCFSVVREQRMLDATGGLPIRDERVMDAFHAAADVGHYQYAYDLVFDVALT